MLKTFLQLTTAVSRKGDLLTGAPLPKKMWPYKTIPESHSHAGEQLQMLATIGFLHEFCLLGHVAPFAELFASRFDLDPLHLCQRFWIHEVLNVSKGACSIWQYILMGCSGLCIFLAGPQRLLLVVRKMLMAHTRINSSLKNMFVLLFSGQSCIWITKYTGCSKQITHICLLQVLGQTIHRKWKNHWA